MRHMHPSPQRKSKRQLIWKLLSLWALLALAVPSLVWACPMNGGVTSGPAPLCPCLQKAQNANSDALEVSMHKCCKKLPFPASDSSGDYKNGSPLIPNLNSFKLIHSAAMSTPAEFAAFALPATAHELNLAFVVAPSPTTSPPRLSSQQLSRLYSGRSPPL